MTKSFVLGVSLATALACAATGAWAQTKPDKAAQTFVTKAVQGNLAEVSMGQLAQEKGDSDGVRSFGQQLVTDHTAANKRAVSIASEMGMTPPSEPSAKQTAEAEKMGKMSGAAFDRAFVRHMLADHRKEIAAYRKAGKMKNEAAAAMPASSGVSRRASTIEVGRISIEVPASRMNPHTTPTLAIFA